MPRSVSAFRSILAVSIAALFLVPTAGAQNAARTVADTVPLAADGEVTIDNHEGSIEVTAWNRESVQYEAQIMPTDEDPDAEKVQIRVEQNGNRLQLATSHEEADDESVVFGFTDDGWQWGGTNIPDVHYTLKIPANASLSIDDHESTIDVTRLEGALRIDTHEGPISVSDHGADLRLDSHDGPISVTDHRGDVTIDSHESRIDLHRIDGRVEINTHEADIKADEVRGGVRLDTHDGTATFSFAALTDDVIVDTHDARVTLVLPGAAGFDLNTDFNEDVVLVSDFDLRSIRIQDDHDDEVNYRGDINGGGPEIYLESHDGDFELRSH